jgi:hypothetical protein
MSEVLMSGVMTDHFENGRPYSVQLVEVDASPVPSAEPAEGDRLTSPTGIRTMASDSVTALSGLLAHIAGQVGHDLAALPAGNRPDEVEAEVCLGLSAAAGPVWLAVKGDYTLRAKLTWKMTGAQGR